MQTPSENWHQWMQTGRGTGWTRIYLHQKVVKNDVCMKFHDATGPLYLETDTSGVGLKAKLLQIMDGMSCTYDKVSGNATLCPTAITHKSLLSTEWHDSNTECEALGILHGLKKFPQYCFMREVCIITAHKLFMAILNKDVTTLSHQLQHIVLRIQQYRGISFTSLTQTYTSWTGNSRTNIQRTRASKSLGWS